MALSETARRRVGVALTALSATIIAFLTLYPLGFGPPPATRGGYLLTDVLQNILLFLPLGAGLGLLRATPVRAAVIGGLASITVELAQRFLIPGRFPSLHDVIANTAGAALGAVAVLGAWDSESLRRRLTLPVAGLILLWWTVGIPLLRPVAPETRVWYGQWAHEFTGTARFQGRIHEVTLQGRPVRDGALDDTAELRAAIRSQARIDFSLRFTTAVPARGGAQIVAVVDGEGGEIASLWQHGTDLRGRVRLVLSGIELRTPWFRLEDALPSAPDVPVAAALRATPRGVRLEVTRPSGTLTREFPLSAAMLWTVIAPFEPDRRLGWNLPTLLSTAAMFGLLGLLAGPRWTLGAATVLAALLGAPLVLGGRAAPFLAWAGAAIGFASGVLAARGFRRRKHAGPLPEESGPARRGTGAAV